MTSASKGFCTRENFPLGKSAGRRDAVYLPPELLLAILSLIPLQGCAQETLHSCCLVSRSWYSVAVTLLYRSPIITMGKYHLFNRTLCPPQKHQNHKNMLSEYVKTLNLRGCCYGFPDDSMEKLLGEVRRGLEVFVAPDTRHEFS
jgi:hypothetical protein